MTVWSSKTAASQGYWSPVSQCRERTQNVLILVGFAIIHEVHVFVPALLFFTIVNKRLKELWSPIEQRLWVKMWRNKDNSLTHDISSTGRSNNWVQRLLFQGLFIFIDIFWLTCKSWKVFLYFNKEKPWMNFFIVKPNCFECFNWFSNMLVLLDCTMTDVSNCSNCNLLWCENLDVDIFFSIQLIWFTHAPFPSVFQCILRDGLRLFGKLWSIVYTMKRRYKINGVSVIFDHFIYGSVEFF